MGMTEKCYVCGKVEYAAGMWVREKDNRKRYYCSQKCYDEDACGLCKGWLEKQHFHLDLVWTSHPVSTGYENDFCSKACLIQFIQNEVEEDKSYSK